MLPYMNYIKNGVKSRGAQSVVYPAGCHGLCEPVHGCTQSRMDHWAGKVAIVTGASSGIGAAITEELVKAGIKVVGVARRVQNIRELANKLKGKSGHLYPMECDMRKEDDILRVFQWTEKELGRLDILINNAAVISTDSIIESSTETYRTILDVNVLAVAICSREAINLMRKHKATCHIINISSIAGHNAEIIKIPASIYSASKYAVIGMSHTLRHELGVAKLPIKITCISPGVVKTEMAEQILKGVMEQAPVLVSKDIANAVLYALATPSNVQVKELIITPMMLLDDMKV